MIDLTPDPPNTFLNGKMLSLAYGINNFTQVVGCYGTASVGGKFDGFDPFFPDTDPQGDLGPHHAFLWQNGTLVDLGTLGRTQFGQVAGSSCAFAINDWGQVVGASGVDAEEFHATYHAFLWQRGTMQSLGTLWPSTLAPGFYLGSSLAYSINNNGQVVGTSDAIGADGYLDRHAFLWQHGVMTDLNATIDAKDWILGEARGINKSGQITGIGAVNGQLRAFLLTPVPVLRIEYTHPWFASVGTNFEQGFYAIGGDGKYDMAVRVDEPANLPEGLDFEPSESGASTPQSPMVTLRGTPKKPAKTSITVFVVDGSGQKASKTFVLNVQQTDAPRIISYPYLPDGTVGTSYDFSLEAILGYGKYKWSVVNVELPEGLFLLDDGRIHGTPTWASIGQYGISIGVADESGQTSSDTFILCINPPDDDDYADIGDLRPLYGTMLGTYDDSDVGDDGGFDAIAASAPPGNGATSYVACHTGVDQDIAKKILAGCRREFPKPHFVEFRRHLWLIKATFCPNSRAKQAILE